MKTFEQKLKLKQKEDRTFEEGTTFGDIQDKLAELELKIEELEK